MSFLPPIDEFSVRQYSAISLAYVGDAVLTLYVREKQVATMDKKVNSYHNEAIRYLSAVAQSEILESVTPILTSSEADIVKRGRNAHSYSKAKNASQAQYSMATGLETLIGHLYLSGQNDRLEEILKLIF